MVDVIGWDIGGANTKAVLLSTQNGKVCDLKIVVEYFPVWKEPEKLASVLSSIKGRLNASGINAVGVTMTAELSDAYQTKREGVHKILFSVEKIFPDLPIHVLATDAQLISPNAAKAEPLKVASANWAATGWLVGKKLADCVVVDVGSTSTSIIPIINGQVSAVGKTDLEKLIYGELVYTGSLRTNVATIVKSIPIRNAMVSVASELFALTGDVHLTLGNIAEDEYTCETADGRGKTKPEALARLARVVCADIEMLSEQEIMQISQYIYDKQIMQVADGLTKVYSRLKSLGLPMVPAVVAGLGKDFLAKKAAQKIGAETIDLGRLIHRDAALAAPAVGVALMTASKLEGKIIHWMQP